MRYIWDERKNRSNIARHGVAFEDAKRIFEGPTVERLRGLRDDEIRKGIEVDPDVHTTDEAFWKNAKIVLPRRKEVATMRLDADLLEWFRQQKGYQTRINAILRAYMKANSAR
jgi:uncharacterized protein (DUF4415 family)